MAKLFISFYAFITLSLIVISSVLDVLLPSENTHSPELQVLSELTNSLKKHPQIFASALTNKNLTFQTLHLSDIAWPNELRDKIRLGENVILYDNDGQTIFVPLENDSIIAISIPDEAKQNKDYFFVYAFVFLILLAALTAAWSWPLWRDLSKVNQSAQSFDKHGHLQAIEVRKSSLIYPIAKTLNGLNDKVADVLNNQRMLTGAVAHEFRTPIARLKFALAMHPTPESKEWVALQSDLDELETLVQELLDYTQYESIEPELNVAELPLKALCENLVSKFAVSTECNISVGGDACILNGDGHFIERAISNLLANAIRHAKSKVRIGIECDEKHIILSVDDDGAGIKTEMMTKIFTPFYRPDAGRDRIKGGAGLGLAIVQRIQHWHGGECYAETSATLGGARLVLMYPKD